MKLKSFKYLLIICFITISSKAISQIVIAGFVTSKKNQNGVSAKIKIKRAGTGKIVAVTRSSKNSGSYFTRVKEGIYDIEVTANGYEILNNQINLSNVHNKRSIYKNFELTLQPKITVKEEDKIEDKASAFLNVDIKKKRQLKRIGLMFSVKHKETLNDNEPLSNENKQFLSYMEGAKMAIDSLKKDGFNIELIVLDNERDSAKTAEIIRSGMIDSLDILIGPIHNDLLKQTLRYCHAKKIINISPLSVSNLNLLSPFYYMMSPSIETHALELSKWARNKYIKDHKVLIHQKEFNKHEKEFIKFFSKLPRTDTIIGDKPSPEELILKLKKDTPNIIFLASSKFSYSYYILSQLSLLEDDYRFTIIGMPHWVKYEGLDVNYLTKNNVIFSTNCWLDKDSEDLKTFNQEFLAEIKTLPNKYAYMGFDHIITTYPLLYIGNKEFLEIERTGLTNAFKIKAMNRRSKIRRYENSKVKIVQFKDNGINLLN